MKPVFTYARHFCAVATFLVVLFSSYQAVQAQARLVADFNTEIQESELQGAVVGEVLAFEGGIYFTAHSQTGFHSGTQRYYYPSFSDYKELFYYDGVNAPQLIPVSPFGLSHVRGLTAYQGKLYFTAADLDRNPITVSDYARGKGESLWEYDPQKQATRRIEDHQPITYEDGRDFHPHNMSVWDERLYFIAQPVLEEGASKNNLWYFDGQDITQVWVPEGAGEEVWEIIPFGEELLIITQRKVNLNSDYKLWKLNKEGEVSELVESEEDQRTGRIVDHIVFEDKWFFHDAGLSSGVEGADWWVYDSDTVVALSDFFQQEDIGLLVHPVVWQGEMVFVNIKDGNASVYIYDGQNAAIMLDPRLAAFRTDVNPNQGLWSLELDFYLVPHGSWLYIENTLSSTNGLKGGMHRIHTNGTLETVIEDEEREWFYRPYKGPTWDPGADPQNPKTVATSLGDKLYFTKGFDLDPFEDGNYYRMYHIDADGKLVPEYKLQQPDDQRTDHTYITSIVSHTDGLYLTVKDSLGIDRLCRLTADKQLVEVKAASGERLEDPERLYSYRGLLYFSASTQTHGREPWVYDEEDGAQLIDDHVPGEDGSWVTGFHGFRDQVYFNLGSSEDNLEAYTYHPETGLEYAFEDVEGLPENPTYYASASTNHLFFDDPASKIGIYQWDGVNAPKLHALDIEVDDPFYDYIQRFRAVQFFNGWRYEDHLLFYSLIDYELWNLNADGRNGLSNVAANLPEDNIESPLSPYGFTQANATKVYFSAYNSENGRELWEYEFNKGMSLVANLKRGLASSHTKELTLFNNKLYFTADDDEHGVELMVYDGVNPPTVAADVRPGRGSSHPMHLTVHNGKLYFVADDGVHGRELWVLDAEACLSDCKVQTDLNDDGYTSIFDVDLFVKSFGTPCSGVNGCVSLFDEINEQTGQKYCRADFNGDGFVSLFDLYDLSRNFGEPNTPEDEAGKQSSTPELYFDEEGARMTGETVVVPIRLVAGEDVISGAQTLMAIFGYDPIMVEEGSMSISYKQDLFGELGEDQVTLSHIDAQTGVVQTAIGLLREAAMPQGEIGYLTFKIRGIETSSFQISQAGLRWNHARLASTVGTVHQLAVDNKVTTNISAVPLTQAASKVAYYPNPATDQLTLTGLSHEQVYQVQFTDLLGVLVLTTEVNAAQPTVPLSATLPAGQYQLSVVDAEGLTLSVGRVMVNR